MYFCKIFLKVMGTTVCRSEASAFLSLSEKRIRLGKNPKTQKPKARGAAGRDALGLAAAAGSAELPGKDPSSGTSQVQAASGSGGTAACLPPAAFGSSLTSIAASLSLKRGWERYPSHQVPYDQSQLGAEGRMRRENESSRSL